MKQDSAVRLLKMLLRPSAALLTRTFCDAGSVPCPVWGPPASVATEQLLVDSVSEELKF